MKTRKMILSVILSMLILVIAQLLSLGIASGFSLIKIPVFICNIIAGILYVVISYYLLKLFCKKFLKADLKEFYIPKFKIKIKWLLIAILLPIAVSGIYLLMSGSFQQNDFSISEKLSLLSSGIFFTGFGAGFVVEMVFRGIIMNSVEKRFNKRIAVLVPSILFGSVHIIGMKFSLLSCLLVLVAGTMVGVMFSLIAVNEKSIWNSAIVHSMWNIIIIGGILSIGTAVDKYSIYSYVLETKSFMLTGGEFGIESSIVSVVAYFVVSVFAYYCIKKKTVR